MDEAPELQKEQSLVEGTVNFKQGLRSRWERAFTSIYPNLLCVYTDFTKEIELFQFDAKTSWISAGAKSQNGLFVLNSDKDSSLYLFEIGSDLLLRKWLQVLSDAGWKSAIITSNVRHRSRDTESKLQGINDLEKSFSLSHSEGFDATFDRTLMTKAKSASLPSLDSLLDELNTLSSSSSSSTRPHSFKPLNDEPYHPVFQTSVSESGYCSKESLIVDEKQQPRRRTSKQEQEKDTSQDVDVKNQVNSDINEVFSPPTSPQDKMVTIAAEKTMEQNGTQPLPKPDIRVKSDAENSLETLFKDPTHDEIRGLQLELDDPDATPKLEKKASMSQIISNIKSKLGSTASRKKGKKTNKRLPRQDVFSSRLLWNNNSQWKDRWFLYENGILAGYKDVGFKPADIMIDVRTCTLTAYNDDEIMRRLNLFKLTTSSNVAHIFAAWTEEQYDTWIELLSFYADKRENLDDKDTSDGIIPTNESTEKQSDVEDSIIPYDRALSAEQRKNNSSSSDTSTTVLQEIRIDSIDSGNDGDESGLESSVNSFETSKRMERDRKRLFRNEMNETQRTPQTRSENPLRNSIKNLRLDFPRQESIDSTTSTEHDSQKSFNSPNVEISTPTSDENDTKKSKRSSFSYKQKISSIFDKNGNKLKGDNNQSTRAKASSYGDEDKLRNIAEGKSSPIAIKNAPGHELEYETNSLSLSADSPRSRRPASLDTAMQLRESSIDTTEHHWDTVFDADTKFKKSSIASEDDNSECGSVPSTSSLHVTDEQKHDEFEDVLREETLLRKRRNSLTLERGQIAIKLEALTDTSKKQQKQDIEVNDKKEKVEKLEMRLEDIDTQIEIIDKRIDLRVNPTFKKKIKSSNGKKSSGNGIMTKLTKKNKQKSMDQIHSKSVESLISSGSQGSSINPSPHIDKKLLNHTFSDSSELSATSSHTSQSTRSSGDLTGLQELMLTTQKLENSKNKKKGQKLLLNPLLSMSGRSKSVGHMDLLENSTAPTTDINQNHTTAQSQLIIEDFEKFSAMLTNQMKKSQMYHEPIDV